MSILFFTTVPTNLPAALTQLGAALAFVLPAIVVSIVAAYPLEANIKALARQPLMQPKLMRLLLLTQIMLQTPILFGFLISVFIHTNVETTVLMTEGIKMIASGLVFGLGSIGPIIGLAYFARQASVAIGRNSTAYDNIFAFSFVSQGIIETPVLFVFVVSLMLCFAPLSVASYAGIAYLMSALAMSFTTVPAGISSGIMAGSACEEIGSYNHRYPEISRTSLLGQVFIETNTIYGLIIVFIMIFTLP